jgi:predicted esterase/LysM repeat protein
MKFFNSRQFVKFVSGFFLALLFLGALGWAKERDPFVQKWFMPKPMRRYPTVIFAHGSGEVLLNDGIELRQMAELGLAAVSLEYDKTNKTAFDTQFSQLLYYLNQQSWVDTNAIAWVGFSLGANATFEFLLKHPEQQPQLLVQLSGKGIDQSTFNFQLSTNLHCPVLLVHGEQDEGFPVADTKRLAATLQDGGVPVELKVIPNLPHIFEPECAVIFRAVGEYCLTHLTGKNAWQNYRSIAQWQAEVPPLWLWWLPAAIWAGGWFIWTVKTRAKIQPVKTPLSRGEIVLRWFAVLLAIGALSVTALHLVTPLFAVGDTTSVIARRFLVQPKERASFEYLVAQPIWRGQRLKTLLEHVELADYNRELVNWQVDDKVYRNFVLSPVIELSTNLNWRRPLWEEFYPRIRHESSTEDAARIVVRHLRERVTIATMPNPSYDVPLIWLRQITDEAGFEIICVAALRSVGVPARLDSQHQAEFWNGDKWQTAPMPSVMSW